MSGEAKNTDRELWREPDEGNGSYYADSIHVTKEGGIGINAGGTVFVKPLREWHRLATLSTLSTERDGALEEAAKIVKEMANFGWQGSEYYCESCKNGIIHPDAEDIANKILALKSSPPVAEDVVGRTRINADYFNLILKECGVENSERAAVQICEFIEGKRNL